MDVGFLTTSHISSEKVSHHGDGLAEGYIASETDDYEGSTGGCVEDTVSNDNVTMEKHQSRDRVPHSLDPNACSTVPAGDTDNTTTSSAVFHNSPSPSEEPSDSPSVGSGTVTCNEDHGFLSDESLSNDLSCFATDLNPSVECKSHEQINDEAVCEAKETNIESNLHSEVKIDNCSSTKSFQSDNQTNVNGITFSQEKTGDTKSLSCDDNKLTISFESENMSKPQVIQNSSSTSFMEKEAMTESVKSQYTTDNTDDEEDSRIKSQKDDPLISDSIDEKVCLFGRESPPPGDKTVASFPLPSLNGITSTDKELDTASVFIEESKRERDGFGKSDLQVGRQPSAARECGPACDHPVTETLIKPTTSNTNIEQTVRENNENKSTSFDEPFGTEMPGEILEEQTTASVDIPLSNAAQEKESVDIPRSNAAQEKDSESSVDIPLSIAAQEKESGSRNGMESDIDHSYLEECTEEEASEPSKGQHFEIRNKGQMFGELIIQQSDVPEFELQQTSVPEMISSVTVETSHDEERIDTTDDYHWCEDDLTETEKCFQPRSRSETSNGSNASFGESETDVIWSSSTDSKDTAKDDDLDFTIEINEDYDGHDESIGNEVEMDLSHAQDDDRDSTESCVPERPFLSENTRNSNPGNESETENLKEIPSHSSGRESPFKIRPVECFQNYVAVESNKKKLLHDHSYFRHISKGKGILEDEVTGDHTYNRDQTITKLPYVYRPHPQFGNAMCELGSESSNQSENTELYTEDTKYVNMIRDHSYQTIKEDMFLAHSPLVDGETNDGALTVHSFQTHDEDGAVSLPATQTDLNRDKLHLETKKRIISVKTILNRPEHSKNTNLQATCGKQGTTFLKTRTDLNKDRMLLVTTKGIVSVNSVLQGSHKQSQLSKEYKSLHSMTQQKNQTGHRHMEHKLRIVDGKVIPGSGFKSYPHGEYERNIRILQDGKHALGIKSKTDSEKAGLQRPHIAHPQQEAPPANKNEATKTPVIICTAKPIQTGSKYPGYMFCYKSVLKNKKEISNWTTETSKPSVIKCLNTSRNLQKEVQYSFNRQSSDQFCKLECPSDKETQTRYQSIKSEEDAKPKKKDGDFEVDVATSICQTVIPSDVTNESTFEIPSNMPLTFRRFHHLSKRNLKGAYLVRDRGSGYFVFKKLSSFHLKDGVYIEAIYNKETDKQLAQYIGTLIQDPCFEIIENVPFIRIARCPNSTAIKLWKLRSYTENCHSEEMPLKIGAVFSLRPDNGESENSVTMLNKRTNHPVILKNKKVNKVCIDTPKLGKRRNQRCQAVKWHCKLSNYRYSIPLDEVEFWSKCQCYYDRNSSTQLRKYCRVVLKSLDSTNQRLKTFEKPCSKRCRQRIVCLSLNAKKPKLEKEMRRLCKNFGIPLVLNRLTEEKCSYSSNDSACTIKIDPNDTDVDVCNIDTNEDQGLIVENQLDNTIDEGERSDKNDFFSSIDTNLGTKHKEHLTNEVQVTLKEVPSAEWGGIDTADNQIGDKKEESLLCTRTIKKEQFSESYGELSNTTRDSNSRKRCYADDNGVDASGEDILRNKQDEGEEGRGQGLSPNNTSLFEPPSKCEKISQLSEDLPSIHQIKHEQIDGAKGSQMESNAGLQARIRNLREQLKQREKDVDAMKENLKHFTELPD